MIFAATNWLSISINILLIVFVFVCLLMALLILMQRPKQEGLGAAFGGGVTDQVFGARTTNVLQKGTVYLGSLFFLLSLTLAILIGKQTKQKTLITDEKPVVAEEQSEAEGGPEAEEAQDAPKSLADELPAQEEPASADATEAAEPEAAAEQPEAPAESSGESEGKAEEKTEDPAAPQAEENSADKP